MTLSYVKVSKQKGLIDVYDSAQKKNIELGEGSKRAEAEKWLNDPTNLDGRRIISVYESPDMDNLCDLVFWLEKP